MWPLIFILSIILIVYYHINNREYKRKISKIKSEFALPIFGHSFLFGGNIEDILPALERMWVKLGRDKFVLKLGPIDQVILTKPEDVEVVLSSYKHIKKNIFYKNFEGVFGPCTITYTLSKWYVMRKNLAPVFSFKKFDRYLNVVREEVDVVLNNLNDGDMELTQAFLNSGLRVMCQIVLGADMKANENFEGYLEDLLMAMHLASKKTFSAWKSISFIYNLTSEGKKLQKCVKSVKNFNKLVTDSKREFYKKRIEKLANIAESDDFDGLNFEELSMTEHLILMKKPNGDSLTDEEILNEITFLIIGGVETVASAISYALYNISLHPEIQEKLYEEQLEITDGKVDSEIEYKDTVKMKYLERVIKESMRIHTPAPLFGRQITENTKLPDDTELEAGTNILLLPYLTHRNPKLFPNPEKFDPDRFLNTSYSPYAYFPFCAGPRNCIGLKIGMVQVKFTLASVLRRFNILPSNCAPPKLVAQPMLMSSNGVHVRFQERKHISIIV